jgi:hypothetical protein
LLRGGLGRGYCGDGRIKFIVSLVCVVGFLSPSSLSLIKVEEPIVVVVISANIIQSLKWSSKTGHRFRV